MKNERKGDGFPLMNSFRGIETTKFIRCGLKVGLERRNIGNYFEKKFNKYNFIAKLS